jgi:glycosyltransferase involved in cell wall biosynthesis
MLHAALLRRPAAIVFDSEFGKRRLLHHHPRLAARARLVVLPPGLEPPPATVAPGRATAPYFLTVGAIEPRRNHLTLLRAYRRAREAGLGLNWVVVGDSGHLATSIVGELTAAEGVDVRGFVPAAELEQLYGGALFAATPSWSEGFGYPPLEAMARGVPVVCSTGSALDETVGDAALRVDPGDEQAWLEALLEMQGDQALRERLASAGRACAERYDWGQVARDLLALHHSLA